MFTKASNPQARYDIINSENESHEMKATEGFKLRFWITHGDESFLRFFVFSTLLLQRRG